MAEKTLVYIRDDEEMDKTKWDELLNKDFEEAKPDKPNGIMDIWEDSSRDRHNNYIHDIDDIYNYLDYGGDIYVNGHHFATKITEWIYGSVSEFCDVLFENINDWEDLISDMISSLTDDEIRTLLSKTKRVRIENGKIIEKVEDE